MKKLLYILSGVIVAFAGTIFAVQTSVPSAPGGGFFLVSTTTGNYIATTSNPLYIGSLVASTTATSTFKGPINDLYTFAHFGSTTCSTGGLSISSGFLQGIEYCGNDNTDIGGVQLIADNNGNGAQSWVGLTLNNDLADATLTHFAGLYFNSSRYTSTFFGGMYGIPNELILQNADGPLAIVASTSTGQAYISFVTQGTASSSEKARITAGGNFGIATTSPGTALGVQGNMFIAGNITSTSTLKSTFPYASSTAASAGTYCLDFCITAWGSGTAGFPWTLKTVVALNSTFSTTSLATTTSIWTQGVYFASSTLAASQFPYASTTALTAINASTTNLVIDIAGSSGTTCLQASATGNVTSTGSACGGNVTINTAGILTGGGTGTSFNLNASSSPHVGYVYASSTSATSTFRGDVVFSNLNKYFMVGTSSGFYPQTIFSTSTSQLALSSGSGQPQWTIRSVGGYLFFSTTTNSGPATSTPAGITINGNAGTSGLFVGTTTNSAATGLAVAGTGYWTGLTASAGLQTGILCLSSVNEVINESVACVASAQRFKEAIAPLTVGLDEVMKLKPVSFKWKDSFNGALKDNANYGGTQYSLIADEVQKVDPHLVTVETGTTTFDGKEYPAGTVHGLADMNHWVALLVKSIQEMWQKITGIDERVIKLEKENAELRARLDRAGI